MSAHLRAGRKIWPCTCSCCSLDDLRASFGKETQYFRIRATGRFRCEPSSRGHDRDPTCSAPHASRVVFTTEMGPPNGTQENLGELSAHAKPTCNCQLSLSVQRLSSRFFFTYIVPHYLFQKNCDAYVSVVTLKSHLWSWNPTCWRGFIACNMQKYTLLMLLG